MSLLSTGIAIFAWIALCFTVWAVGEIIAYYRWQHFLKLLDERLRPFEPSHDVTGDLPNVPSGLFHNGTHTRRRNENHAGR